MHDDRKHRKAVEKAREWERQAQLERDTAVRALLEHRHGRRYLYWLLDITRAIGVNAFTGNALTTAFREGEQNIGQQVMAHLLEVAPDGFLKMLKEVADERAEPDAGTDPEPESGTYADTFSDT